MKDNTVPCLRCSDGHAEFSSIEASGDLDFRPELCHGCARAEHIEEVHGLASRLKSFTDGMPEGIPEFAIVDAQLIASIQEVARA